MCAGMPREYEQIAERLDHVGCLQLPCDTYRQALSSELVDDAQHPERLVHRECGQRRSHRTRHGWDAAGADGCTTRR